MLLFFEFSYIVRCIAYIFLSVLFVTASFALDGRLRVLQELIQEDPFFDARFIDLKQFDTNRSSLEFALMRQLPKRVPVNVGDAKMSKFAASWVQHNTPRGLIEYCLSNNYKLQIHYGSAVETLFFMAKDKVNQVFHIMPSKSVGIQFVVKLAEGIEPGLIVITNISSQLDLFETQSALVHFRHNGKAYSAADISTYNFHLIDEDAYRSAPFKENLVGMPVGITKALVGAGSALVKEISSRKFAAMSIDLLKGLYGDKFLQALKRELIEEGFLGVMDWNVESFTPLETWQAQFLNQATMNLFKTFQQQLTLILKQRKDHRLTELLLIGNELAISKDHLVKSEILESLQFSGVRNFGLDIYSAFVPVKTRKGNERLFFTDGVHGDSVESLIQVLKNLGFTDFIYADGAVVTSNRVDVGEVVSPRTIFKEGEKISVDLAPNKSFDQKNLVLEHSYIPTASTGTDRDLISRDVYHFINALKGSQINHALLLVGSYEKRADELAKILENRKVISNLVDPILNYYGVEDILLNAKHTDFGFSSLDEKVAYFNLRNGISNERSVLFKYALRNFLQHHLSDKADYDAYMRSYSLIPSNDHIVTLNPFNYFLDQPFEDQDVIAHIIQVEKALEELVAFLKLMGETSYDINIQGDFLKAMFTPLSPLHIAVNGISQKSFFELMKSPFGDNESSRKFLIRVVPVGVDYGPKLVIKQPLVKGQIEQLYRDILREHGIQTTDKGLFQSPKTKKLEKFEQLRHKVNRYLQGCDTFLSIARVDFIREKSQVFSIAPWSQERVDHLVKNLREGVARLTAEGLQIKAELRKLSVQNPQTERYMNELNEKISAMDMFVQDFIGY